MNAVYQALAHSEINLRSKVWDVIWITPAAHRIHHSNRTEHFDRNFGVLTLWDYVFGTYLLPSDEKLSYGVADGETFNRQQYFVELFDNVRRWISPAWRRAGSIHSSGRSDASLMATTRGRDGVARVVPGRESAGKIAFTDVPATAAPGQPA